MSCFSAPFSTKALSVLERYPEKNQDDRAKDFSRPITRKETDHIYDMNMLRAEGQAFNQPLANGVNASKLTAHYGHQMDGKQFVGDEWQYLPRPLCCPPQSIQPYNILY